MESQVRRMTPVMIALIAMMLLGLVSAQGPVTGPAVPTAAPIGATPPAASPPTAAVAPVATPPPAVAPVATPPTIATRPATAPSKSPAATPTPVRAPRAAPKAAPVSAPASVPVKAPAPSEKNAGVMVNAHGWSSVVLVSGVLVAAAAF